MYDLLFALWLNVLHVPEAYLTFTYKSSVVIFIGGVLGVILLPKDVPSGCCFSLIGCI